MLPTGYSSEEPFHMSRDFQLPGRSPVIACEGMDIKTEKDRDMYFGGGADVISLVDEYAFAERRSGTTQVWAWRLLSDATAPTS